MSIAIWIITICEVIRMLQNAIQIHMVRHDTSARDNAYAEFVKSLKSTDKEFVRRLLEEYERMDDGKNDRTKDREVKHEGI